LGRHISRGSILAISFLRKNPLAVFYLINYKFYTFSSVQKEIGAKRRQVCAETMTGLGGICLLEAAETALPVGELFFQP
jgi:hypothetical protein